MRVNMLGTGAPLHPERATTGLLIEAEGLAPLLIDCCGGLELSRQLTKVGKSLSDIRHVVLTHRHGDHIGGVMALGLALVPCQYFGLADTLKAAQDLLQVTFGEYDFNPQVDYQEICPGDSYQIAGYTVQVYAATHRVKTVALRIEQGGQVLAFSSDSLPSAALLDCARNADLFICDALCASTDLARERLDYLMHPSASEAARIAQEAGAKSLLLTHLARFATESTMLEEAMGLFAGPVRIAQDGDIICIGHE